MDEGFIGEIRLFGGTFAPTNWAFCDGTLLQVSQNDALFSILGTIYGGDGRTTFALPDLRGRVAVQEGSGPGLTTRQLGSQFGSETNTLNADQLPQHSHTTNTSTFTPTADSANGNTDDPANAWPAAAQDANGTRNIYNPSIAVDPVDMAPETVTVQVGSTGGNSAIPNIQPFQAVNYIICLLGTYPSRT
ncbi:MAG: tail fiber protein [Bacteroidota bacterium]